VLLLPTTQSVLDGFGRALQMNGKAVPFSDRIKSAPSWAEREAENFAIKLDGPLKVIHQ